MPTDMMKCIGWDATVMVERLPLAAGK